jgi:hypothetical protein
MDAMELFERYLQAVRKYLPWERQNDIVAELRANLEAQREEREAELGRPLTEGEMIDWLKQMGPPHQVAARYQAPRYLIGPAIFPMYWHVLRLVALWLTVAYGISMVARVFVQSLGPEWVAGQIAAYPSVLMIAIAWVTLVFVVLEFVSERYPEKSPDFLATGPRWSPAHLPPLERPLPPGMKPRSLATAIAEFIVGVALLIWMLLIPRYPFLLLGPGAAYLEHSPVRLAPIAITFFWAIVIFNVIQLTWQGLHLLSGKWRIRGTVHHLVTKGLGIVPIAILLAAPGRRFLELNPAEAGRLPSGFDFAKINHDLFGGVVVIALIVGIQFAWDMWKARPGAGPQPLRAVL